MRFYKSLILPSIAISLFFLIACSKTINSDTCDKSIYKFHVYGRYRCYIGLAQNSNDEKICEKIDLISYKDECLANIAIRKNDNYLCTRIRTDIYREKCYSDTPKNRLQTTSPETISKAEESMMKNEVEPNIKEQYISDCKNQDQSYRDNCFSYIARQIHDESVCQYVINVENKQKCINAVTGRLSDSVPTSNNLFECKDSDGGRNSSVAGVTTNGRSTKYDSCFHTQLGFVPDCDGETCLLIEYFCAEDNTIPINNYKCLNGCSNGACI